MTRFAGLLAVVALFALAVPAVAQEGDPVAEETPEEPTEVASTTHDWEFVLQPNDKAPDATATVMVTEGDADNAFVIEVVGLPPVDELDDETRDVNAYTVWIVPSRDKVQESTLAGSLSVDPEGLATFEGTTDLDTFGILILATENGAPETLGGVPILTGIPAMETGAEGQAPPAAEQPEPGVEPQPEPGVEPQPEPGVEPQPEPEVEPQPYPDTEPEAEVPQPQS